MPIFYYYDPTYIILLPALLISLYAQFRTSSAYAKYSRRANERGITGLEAARRILAANGLSHVQIQVIGGNLSDHFDPTANVLRLSNDVANKASVASVAVAAHECGHAIQHAQGYAPIRWRSAIVPVANLASSASWILLIMGIIFSAQSLVTLGIVFFVGYVLFHLVTLPVEFNASNRAMAQIRELGLSSGDELSHERSMLNACALTYVAAAVMAILQLLRLIVLSRGSRRD
ncbi:MAG: zinc metallopeptidase [Anaerofustis stercorihominis]|nr:zinc metallopeptidase [Anaerofustis stercorihominis]